MENIESRYLSIVDLIEQNKSEKVAIYYKEKEISYNKLIHHANKIATFLISKGIKKGDKIGVYFRKRYEVIATILGVIKTGAAYVPIDASFPVGRVEYILNDANIKYVLTDDISCFQQVNNDESIEAIDVISIISKEYNCINSFENCVLSEDDLVYIIYTSGSTGEPKGVKVSHGALKNFLVSMQKEPGINSLDKVLFNTTICFDISGLEIFLPLISNAAIVMSSIESTVQIKELINLIEDYEVTILQGTPTLLSMLLDNGMKQNMNLKILCGGEEWNKKLATKLLDICGTLWNMYGPTETTIWSMINKIERGEEIALGHPIDNTYVYILDENMKPVEDGETGELYIGGKGISQGYHNKLQLTTERFVKDTYCKDDKLIYKTGDLVTKRNDKLYYCGRYDLQVKIRGHRIELEEIESKVLDITCINKAVAINDSQENDGISLFYTVDSNRQGVTTDEVKKYLRSELPYYMIPSHIYKIDSFPRTLNGKIDRIKLIEYKENQLIPEVTGLTEIEKEISKIWQEILKIKHINKTDNFLEIGGHSLAIIKLVAKIQEVFDVKISGVEILKKGATIESMANFISNKLIEELDDEEIGLILSE